MIGQVGENSRIIVIKEAVRVKIPKESEDMEFREETPIESGEVIPERWHNAFSIDGVLVNRNFYDFLDGDLGKERTATVQVYEKIARGLKYTALDIFREFNGARPTCTLKFKEQSVGEAYPIQGTYNKFICFV